ncbi:hypothetical protein [Rubritalea sp.]|uniref:hypothetical protein n=1 Tax=Rubritalea sp. TaxID=2109375 RepID=UPI003EF633B9
MKTQLISIFSFLVLSCIASADVVSLKVEPTGWGDFAPGRAVDGVAMAGGNTAKITSKTQIEGLNTPNGVAGPITFIMDVNDLTVGGTKLSFSFDLTLTSTGGNFRTDGGKMRGFVIASGNKKLLEPGETITYSVGQAKNVTTGFRVGDITFTEHMVDSYTENSDPGIEFDNSTGTLKAAVAIRPRALVMHVNVESVSGSIPVSASVPDLDAAAIISMDGKTLIQR